ncbi:hypothetical protein BsWGS_04976 [Bradybaena similaris]
MAAPAKQIKIKTGVVKRITKEKVCYEKEATQLEEKLDKMKAEGKDAHDISKQKKEADLEGTEEYKEANAVMKAAEPHLA